MSIKLVAPAGTGGVVQGRSGVNYTVASDGTISNVQFLDVDGLLSSGWIYAVNRRGQYTTPGVPVAASASLFAGTTTLSAGNTITITQPDMGRQAQVVLIAGGGSTTTLTAGILSLVYTANDTTVQTDNLNFGALALGGTMTLSSSKGVEHLISGTVVGPVTGG